MAPRGSRLGESAWRPTWITETSGTTHVVPARLARRPDPAWQDFFDKPQHLDPLQKYPEFSRGVEACGETPQGGSDALVCYPYYHCGEICDTTRREWKGKEWKGNESVEPIECSNRLGLQRNVGKPLPARARSKSHKLTF